MNKNIGLLERIYLSILASIFLLIVFTPYIIHSGITVFEEELVEVAIIILLFTVGYAVLSLYRKEAARNLKEIIILKQHKGALENRLTEAFKHIGTVNIQIQEIKSVFSDVQKFPENKKDFGHILQFLADRTLSMVNAGWVLFRIIDTKNLDSLGEYSETRGNSVLPQHKISNKALVSNQKLEGFTVMGSGQENFHIKTFCIIPKAEISSDNEIFIKAVVNQLEMLFLIFTSIYYRDSHFKNRNLSKV
jgi:hypothetical protein